MQQPRLPPFESVLKSREVEDPVNVLVHRPLAYGFVALVLRTPITPNQVTLLALIVGCAAGVVWAMGAPWMMVAGGVLLWLSAIFDGADGILARAKGLSSQVGRAYDGTADLVVAAVSLAGGFAHVWSIYHDPVHAIALAVAIGTTLVQLNLYDFYKEAFLRMTRLDRGGESDEIAAVERRVDDLERSGAPWLARFVMRHVYLPYLRNQEKLVSRLNPLAIGLAPASLAGASSAQRERAAAIYRQHNAWPMRLWALVSLAPHTYILAICGMLDRLDVYLWLRLFAMNAVFVVALVWQRVATRHTRAALATPSAAEIPCITA